MVEMEDLPSDTITNIISRLPVDTLSHSRCVCKQWYNTIYDPYFTNKHLELLSQNKALGHILLMKKRENSNCELHYAEYDDEKPYKIIKINHPPVKYNPYFRAVVGSCNGLLCTSHHINNDPVYICNVMTHESISLPLYIDSTISYPRLIIARGFGYDSSTNQYKVVRIVFDRWNVPGKDGEVQVYTLGEDTEWRQKGKAPYFLRWKLSGVLVKGALHWITEVDVHKDHAEDTKIVAFNLKDEEFRLVPNPPGFEPKKQNFDLVELGGCLCVTEYLDYGRITIWMMKDNTSEKDPLWTREYTIGIEGQYTGVYKAFALTKDGKLLLWKNGVILVSYDPKTGALTQIIDHGEVERLEGVTHMRSMVSLKAMCEAPMSIEGKRKDKKIVETRKRKDKKIVGTRKSKRLNAPRV